MLKLPEAITELYVECRYDYLVNWATFVSLAASYHMRSTQADQLSALSQCIQMLIGIHFILDGENMTRDRIHRVWTCENLQ